MVAKMLPRHDCPQALMPPYKGVWTLAPRFSGLMVMEYLCTACEEEFEDTDNTTVCLLCGAGDDALVLMDVRMEGEN